MSLSYDVFTGAFLSKITEFELLSLADNEREETIDTYMKRSIAGFKKICAYDLTVCDDETRTIDADIPDEDMDEIVDIVSEGMVVQWLKPYLYKQEILENALSTRDFTVFSPAELQRRVGDTYRKAQTDYTQMMREYSYNHGDLSVLHL